MTGNDIRNLFLKYFSEKNHRIVRSASLVPDHDPTLLFTNAGMVQFKRTFLGEESRDYMKAATSQKCVRAGGKHNDLENVGYTARHHTFFEMLGNFSFGDYFKKKSIEYAWDLLVNVYKLPADKLWISIFQDDNDAFDIWHSDIGLDPNRIVRCGEKDNFWSMGATGPCGPCSEIHIDRGEDFGCGQPECKVDCECDRFLEIWNLVFMQFNRDDKGKLAPLPKPSIDTGMGLERLACIIQEVPTNFETDLIFPIINRIEDIAEKKYGDLLKTDVAMKVIADHVRTAAFLICDGVLPSNEGRGYVLRRIMRRAIRYGRNIGLVKPFLHETANVVFDIMKPAYPELFDASVFINSIIHNEEVRFSETLDNGLKLLNETLSELLAKGKTQVPGDVIFKLYDTYGFPVDIVRDVARDESMSLDMAGFNTAMEGQRKKSKSLSSFTKISDAYKNLSALGIKPDFTGYNQSSAQSNILLLVSDGKEIPKAVKDETIELVTESTPFYAESGGQAGDTGMISGENCQINITNTIKDPTGVIIHYGKVISGCAAKGDTVNLCVDSDKRKATACNHTATHILHAVLRDILGQHVKQSGSLVAPDRLRFDFTHFSQIDTPTLENIEHHVNRSIRENFPVVTDEMAAEQAFESGATALFEEKYGDRVRVVSIPNLSKELCGGIHTGRTGDIGLFKITGESSIASGIRRIEALTGDPAITYIQKMTGIVLDAAHMMKEKPETLAKRIEKTIETIKSLEKEIGRLKSELAESKVVSAEDEIRKINGIDVLAKKVSVDSPAALRDLADKLKNKIKSGIIVLGCPSGTKALLVVTVTNDLVGRYHAGNIVKQVASFVGGGGGGRPDMAQAGGTNPENLNQAIENAYEIIKNIR
jgi:alanyl-tRNA synthetase